MTAMPPGQPVGDGPLASGRPVGTVTHRTARNAAIRGVAEVLAKLATLAWTVVAARSLSQQDYGAFAYALSLVLLASALPAWGFDPLLVRRGSRDGDLLPRLHTEALTWQTLLAVPTFLAVGLLAGSGRPSPQAALVLVLLLLAAVPELWSDTARSTASVRQDQLGVSRALVLQRLLTALLIIGALVAGLGVVGVAAGFLAGALAGWLLHVRALRALDVRVRPGLVSRAGMREMLAGTGSLGLSALVLIVLFRADTVLLGLLRDDAAVAVYAVAYRLLETVLFVAYAVKQAVLPVMSAAAGRVRRGVEQGLAVAGLLYLPFAAVVLVEAERVLGLLFGDPYGQQAADVLRWLAPVPVLFAAAYLGQAALVARGRQRTMLIAALWATASNLSVNLVLIPRYAGVGAAIATTLSYVVQVGIVHRDLRRGEGRLRLLRPLAETSVAALVLAAVLLLLDLPLLVELGLGGVVYLAVWWALVRRTAPEQLVVLRGLLPGGRR